MVGRQAALLVCLGLVMLVGCTRHDERIDELRRQYLLAEEPADAVGIAAARDAGGDPREVVVVGRVSAGDFEPWAEGQASFLLAEYLPDDDHASTPGHDPANCPFCRRRAAKASATALVQFHDADGKVLPIDARQLLGVAKDQVVVVRGKAHVDELGVLVVDAQGIHLRR